MPGFLFNNNYVQDDHTYLDKRNLFSKIIIHKNVSIQLYSLYKFTNDTFLEEDNDLILGIEGVVFNSKSLQQEYRCNTMFELIKKLYCNHQTSCFKVFKGSFSGIIFDKNKNEIIFYTNPIGDKPIFYYHQNELLLVSSELKFMKFLFQNKNIVSQLNLAAAYSMLTYGYLIEGLTYYENVHRLLPGEFITFKENKLTTHSYFSFKYNPNKKLTKTEIISQIDCLFKKAVKLQTDKNKEYGLDNWSALSAGLDSRMTTFEVNNQTKGLFNTFTYSPINYIDAQTSSAISNVLKQNKYLHQSLLSGNILKMIDSSIFCNEGLFMYYGAAVLLSFFDSLNQDNIGIIHTGQIGDVIIGTFNHNTKNINFTNHEIDMHSKHYAKKFNDLFPVSSLLNKYVYRDEFSTINRGFLGVNSGSNFIFNQFADSFSPFYDTSLLNFCLTIPIKYKNNSYIYDKWIIQKYPIAGKFRHNGTRKIDAPVYNFYIKYKNKFSHKIKKTFVSNYQSTSVTPLNEWEQKKEIQTYLQEYMYTNINILNQYPELKQDCITLFQKGSALERNQVLTLIGSWKLLKTNT